MKVLTIKSVESLDPELKNEIHYSFGMEKHTDYVFKDRTAGPYAATISLPDSAPVIAMITRESSRFPGYTFIIDDLDLDGNTIERIHVKAGEVTDRKKAAWEWNG
ncbi:MAG: hypothetical protein ACOYXB_11195 [Bacteroidota bacterium]